MTPSGKPNLNDGNQKLLASKLPQNRAKHNPGCQTLDAWTLTGSSVRSTPKPCNQLCLTNRDVLGQDSNFEMTGVLPRWIFHRAFAPEPSAIQPVAEKEEKETR